MRTSPFEPRDVRQRLGAGAPADPEAFWTAFREKAQGLDRAAVRPPSPFPSARVLSVAAALVLLLAGGVGIGLRYASRPSDQTIRSLQVLGPCDAVFILKDEQREGMIVWLGDSGDTRGNGG